MKRTILAVLAALALTACGTLEKQKFCTDYESDYKQYVEIIASGAIPQPEVVNAAKIAALMLETYCNWGVEQTRGVVPASVFDSNGVKRVYPPK